MMTGADVWFTLKKYWALLYTCWKQLMIVNTVESNWRIIMNLKIWISTMSTIFLRNVQKNCLQRSFSSSAGLFHFSYTQLLLGLRDSSEFLEFVFSFMFCLYICSLNILLFLFSDSPFPSHARVVICGGGVQGAAIGYYLAQYGWGKDTIILDQGKIGGGTPWHMSGLIGTYKPSYTETIMSKESLHLYQDLTEKGHKTGFKQCGSLLLARTWDRLTHLRRMKAHSVSRDIECSLLTPSDIEQKYPYLNIKDLQGGLWIPQDAVGDPSSICRSLAKLASSQGVQLFEQIQVHRVLTERKRVSAVETDRGIFFYPYPFN